MTFAFADRRGFTSRQIVRALILTSFRGIKVTCRSHSSSSQDRNRVESTNEKKRGVCSSFVSYSLTTTSSIKHLKRPLSKRNRGFLSLYLTFKILTLTWYDAINPSIIHPLNPQCCWSQPSYCCIKAGYTFNRSPVTVKGSLETPVTLWMMFLGCWRKLDSHEKTHACMWAKSANHFTTVWPNAGKLF